MWKSATSVSAGEEDGDLSSERQLFPGAAGGDLDPFSAHHSVHLRVQQRNGRKRWTTIAGLAPDLDLAKILKYLKKAFCTNGAVVRHATAGLVIQLQGDLRRQVYEALWTWQICDRDMIKVSGA